PHGNATQHELGADLQAGTAAQTVGAGALAVEIEAARAILVEGVLAQMHVLPAQCRLEHDAAQIEVVAGLQGQAITLAVILGVGLAHDVADDDLPVGLVVKEGVAGDGIEVETAPLIAAVEADVIAVDFARSIAAVEIGTGVGVAKAQTGDQARREHFVDAHGGAADEIVGANRIAVAA